MDEFMGSLILGLLVFGLIAVLVFLITRAFWCWYWKISARLEEQQKTNLYLEAIYKLLAQGNAISAVTAELPEVCASAGSAQGRPPLPLLSYPDTCNFLHTCCFRKSEPLRPAYQNKSLS